MAADRVTQAEVLRDWADMITAWLYEIRKREVAGLFDAAPAALTRQLVNVVKRLRDVRSRLADRAEMLEDGPWLPWSSHSSARLIFGVTMPDMRSWPRTPASWPIRRAVATTWTTPLILPPRVAVRQPYQRARGALALKG